MAEYALSRGIFRQTCFHSQQAVEKALKGLLDARLGTHPKSHSLEELLLYNSAIHRELQRWRVQCRRLDLFYIPTRYADALPGLLPAGEPTQADAQEALQNAKAISRRNSRTNRQRELIGRVCGIIRQSGRRRRCVDGHECHELSLPPYLNRQRLQLFLELGRGTECSLLPSSKRVGSGRYQINL